jgi:hypothetical protein
VQTFADYSTRIVKGRAFKSGNKNRNFDARNQSISQTKALERLDGISRSQARNSIVSSIPQKKGDLFEFMGSEDHRKNIKINMKPLDDFSRTGASFFSHNENNLDTYRMYNVLLENRGDGHLQTAQTTF